MQVIGFYIMGKKEILDQLIPSAPFPKVLHVKRSSATVVRILYKFYINYINLHIGRCNRKVQRFQLVILALYM